MPPSLRSNGSKGTSLRTNGQWDADSVLVFDPNRQKFLKDSLQNVQRGRQYGLIVLLDG